jgi:hypothetical protein
MNEAAAGGCDGPVPKQAAAETDAGALAEKDEDLAPPSRSTGSVRGLTAMIDTERFFWCALTPTSARKHFEQYL